MGAIIYLLCSVTALGCCILLYRGYRNSRVPLLFWSSLCFGCLTAENLLLFADRILFPAVDLSLWRILSAFLATVLLLYGLIWKNN
jgi:hypothetical protein